ncbi:hypothetical protein [Oryza sativa Japonica Group]|uniref:Uncharacterized protein n=1 Tax=Oryza sativa subsp. japonica TaxID=39947 RepID=Q5VP74_ORYSJ|nr:hypothetical protein [Oryza sativa Japonica Group]
MAHGSAWLKAAMATRGDAMARQRRTGHEALMRRRRRRDWYGARRGASDGDGDTSGAGLGSARRSQRRRRQHAAGRRQWQQNGTRRRWQSEATATRRGDGDTTATAPVRVGLEAG